MPVAVIVAGGLGTRALSLTGDRVPKALLRGRLPAASDTTYHAITGLWLVIASFQTFVFVLPQRATAGWGRG